MSVLLYVLAGLAAVGLVVGLWLAFGPGPARRRAYRRAQKLLDAGDWAAALALVERLLPGARRSPVWRERLDTAAGECHGLATEAALREQRYEDALASALAAGPFIEATADDQRGKVVEAMLAEVRRLFVAGTGPDETDRVLTLIRRTQRLAEGPAPPPEATFWLALCLLRQNDYDGALAALTACQERVGKSFIDPSLYLGLVLHRLGRPQEALRHLGEANRVDGACPFVTWQMGVSIVAGAGDSGLAVRALQRALGGRGLPLWSAQPERAWVEAFPDGRSFVRKASALWRPEGRQRFICPVLGGDLATIIRQGQIALAQALYRQDRFQESADLYGQLLQQSAPTVMLLRGYGLALARLGQYDLAYKQLRIALEQENPKDPFTAGYLALCGAQGKPTQPGDKPRNVSWALRLLAKYPVLESAEWAGLINSVHAEARLLEMPLAAEDQVLACDALASVKATDPAAAATFAHLCATHPEAARPVHAWLYARAAAEHGATSGSDLPLFALAFRDPTALAEYFRQQGWDSAEAEAAYLERAARSDPGQFPAALGPEYPARGEQFLLERSARFEAAGKPEPARRAAEVLLALAPTSLAAHDRLACLHYRKGDPGAAIRLLETLQRLAPADHRPLVRQALLEQERGQPARRAAAIGRALELTAGPLAAPVRVGVALLGARLALRPLAGGAAGDLAARADALGEAGRLLGLALEADPGHVEALWTQAAVCSVQGDRTALVDLAPRLDRPDVTDARFHYLGAVCALAAGEHQRAVLLAARAAQGPGEGSQPALAAECQFLVAWAQLHRGETGPAREALERVAAVEASPSAVYARALLGRLSLEAGAYDDAARAWQGVDAARRAEWQLDEPLRQVVLLGGLQALDGGRFESAAERFREAGRLGLCDRRLGGLITLALVKAGQRLLSNVVK